MLKDCPFKNKIRRRSTALWTIWRRGRGGTIALAESSWCCGLVLRLSPALAPVGAIRGKCCTGTGSLLLKSPVALLHSWSCRGHRIPLEQCAWSDCLCPVLLSGIVECNGGVAEEDEVEVILEQEPAADQEVPREAVLPEQSPGEFDFNEFFNLDKVPCLASVSVAACL